MEHIPLAWKCRAVKVATMQTRKNMDYCSGWVSPGLISITLQLYVMVLESLILLNESRSLHSICHTLKILWN
jgi:hypothetical protein